MLQLYVTTNSASCRKAEAWLKDHQIPYQKQNLLSNPPSIADLKQMLEMTEAGTSELLSSRSYAFKEVEEEVEKFSLSELLEFIHSQPAILRRPILWDRKKLAVGYDEEEIRVFVPREMRHHSWSCQS